MARFERGNKAATKAHGTPKKPHIAHLLQQFAPDVATVVKEMLISTELQERWICAKEILPYLWPKKAAVTVQEEKPVLTLADYVNAKTPPASASSPSVSIPVETGNGLQE
jgi:hypothetical protein